MYPKSKLAEGCTLNPSLNLIDFDIDKSVFDELEELYFDIEEHQTALLAEYVDEHLEDFAEII